ncbi:hypothetical protein ACJVDH_15410 [Pedobacter sp. AW1-32]|uniref:hypothetical protein n=1 Tax=Pedobacter sp. AW1-32 TaxID=3383026 RepID=UPI003FF0F919
MKKILFILLTFIPFLSLAQQPLSKVAQLQVPKKSEVLTQSAGISYTKSNFKLLSVPNNMANTYQVDNVVVSFQDFKLPYPVDLERIKQSSYGDPEYYFKRKITFSGSIQKFKYLSFFVKTVSKDDESYFWFISESKNLKGIEGCIAFKLKDAEQAKQILDNLLNSIELK